MIAEIHCPNCGRKYDVDSRMIGRSVICAGKTCGLKFRAKAAEAPSDDQEIDLTAFEKPSSRDKKPNALPPPLPPRVRPDTGSGKGRSVTEPVAEDAARASRRRNPVLAKPTTVPGVIVLGCIFVAVLFIGYRVVQSEAKRRVYMTDVRAYVEKARKVVEAWPESPDIVARLCDELHHDLEEIKIRHPDRRQGYFINNLRMIELNLITPSTFAKSREGKEALTKSELERPDHKLHSEYVWANDQVESALQDIKSIERFLP